MVKLNQAGVACLTFSLLFGTFIRVHKLSAQQVKPPSGVTNTTKVDGGVSLPSAKAQQLADVLTQRVEGGMWRLDGGFDSILRITNITHKQDIEVVPAVVMSDGYILKLDPHVVPASGVVTIDIGTALGEKAQIIAAHRSAFGMVAIEYPGEWSGSIRATLQDVDETAMLSFVSSVQTPSVNGQPVSATKQQRLESAWWQPYASATLFTFLGNPTNGNYSVLLRINDENGEMTAEKRLNLGPHGSVMLDAFKLLKAPPPEGATGSLSITYEGGDDSLVAVAGLSDMERGFSHTLHVWESHPERAHSSNTHEIVVNTPGIMYGPALGRMHFPADTEFAPYLILLNKATSARKVFVRATYEADGESHTADVGEITLDASSTRRVDLGGLHARVGSNPDNGVIALSETFVGKETDLSLEAGSVDHSGNYAFEAESTLAEPTPARTFCYWRSDGDTNTMVSLWNFSSKNEDALLTIRHRSGEYALPLHFEPRETREIDLESIIRQRAPDKDGQVIPGDIVEGTAQLTSLTSDERSLLTISSSTSTFNVINGTCTNQCGTCNGVSSVAFVPNPLSVQINDSQSAEIQITYNTGSVYVVNEATWSSSSANANVDQEGLITGVSAGSATITGNVGQYPVGVGYICTGNSLNCPYSSYQASGPVNVYSGTPSITGIYPSDWLAGQTVSGVTLTGTNFGNNTPTLNFNPSSGISYTLTSYNDTTIVANITVAAGVPDEDVTVTVVSGGTGAGFSSGAGNSSSSNAAHATVHSPTGSPEITVIGWVDGTAPDLQAISTSGVTPILVTRLNSNFASCISEVGAWVSGYLRDVLSPTDVTYANLFSIENSANRAPSSVSIDPHGAYVGADWRLFNDAGGSGANNTAAAGITIDPCGSGTWMAWAKEGQPSQFNNKNGNAGTPSGFFYQIAEGRVGTAGRRASETLNNRAVPWIWSVIEFDSLGNPSVQDLSTFPTFSVYRDGQFLFKTTQSGVMTFVQNAPLSETAWQPIP